MTFQAGFDYNQPFMGDVVCRKPPTVFSRPPQCRTSPSRIISGRIEKPRSTHASPAYHGRRRAWTGAVENLLPVMSGSMVNLEKSLLIPGLQQRTMQQQRPLSWHPSTHLPPSRMSPSTYQLPSSTMSPSTYQLPSSTMSPSFALMRYQTPPNNHLAPVTSVQLPHMNQMFDSPPELYVSNGLATSPASSVYSMDCGSNPSPTFQLSSYHHSPAILDSTPITTHLAEYKWIPHGYAYMENQKETEQQTTQHGTSIQEPNEQDTVEEEDHGEVLVALGLYDTPEVSHMSLLSSGRCLKLTESWEPPEEGEGEDEEDYNEEEVEKEADEPTHSTEAITSITSITSISNVQTSAKPKFDHGDLENIHPWPNTVNQATTSGKWWY